MYGTAAEASAAARAAAVEALIERHPAGITLGGETYEAGAIIDPEGFAFGPGGIPEISQSATAIIRKSDYTGTPQRGVVILIDDVAFLIEETSGNLARDLHWKLRCRRAPGEDEE
jgi:hypothetical protein